MNIAEKMAVEGIECRPFSAGGDDERQMRELVFSNAFLGEPFDPICSDERFFGDVVLGPYIKHQPENIHVAIDRASGLLIGYLTGSLGGEDFERTQEKMVRRAMVGPSASLFSPLAIFMPAQNRSFFSHVIFRGEKERPSHPGNGVHWHYQVHRKFRGQGIGKSLLRRFLADAVQAEFGLIWAEVMAYPEKPPEYFKDRGWSVYDAKPTGIFGEYVNFPVEVMCITKSIDM